jgi:excisionase family DNA binding protein
MEPVSVSINEAARALGIGRTKLYELTNSGSLSPIKIGRRTLVTTASLRMLVTGGNA